MRRQKLSVSMNDLNDNEFLRGPDLPHSLSRDIRIQKLQERNIKLQREVIKIERALTGMQQKGSYGIRLPQIKGDVIRKQLENAYKMIKQYQYEINKRKKYDLEGAYVEQFRKNQKVLKEKEDFSDKIRKQIFQIKKQSMDYVKLLKNDTLKKDYEDKESKNNSDIKWLQEKIRRQDNKREVVNANLQKQQELINKIEKELAKQNYSRESLEAMRNRIFNAVQVDDNDEDEELEKPEERDLVIDLDDRTNQSYQAVLGEIKLFRKLQKDYELKIEVLQKQKDDAEDRNYKSRNKLLQAQYEIQRIQARIQQLKKSIDPKALIPTKMDMIVQEKLRNSVKKAVKSKLSMPHLYKFAQIGEATKAGKRFIDRTVIGRKHAKMVEVSFFQSKQGEHQLLGIQAIYIIGNNRKTGGINMLSDPKQAQQKHFSLSEGDYIKTIDCMLSDKNIVVGVSMVSHSNVIIKGGAMTDKRQTIQMLPNQYPVCLYGCLLPTGVQMLGAELAVQQ